MTTTFDFETAEIKAATAKRRFIVCLITTIAMVALPALSMAVVPKPVSPAFLLFEMLLFIIGAVATIGTIVFGVLWAVRIHYLTTARIHNS